MIDQAEEKRRRALAIWGHSRPVESSSRAVEYLRTLAGVALVPRSPAVRYSALVRHPATGRTHPALVAAVVGVEGDPITGIVRHYIGTKGVPPVLALGTIRGGHVPIQENPNPVLVVVEELGKAFKHASILGPSARIWYAPKGAGELDYPADVTDVALFGIGDAERVAAKIARRGKRALVAEGALA